MNEIRYIKAQMNVDLISHLDNETPSEMQSQMMQMTVFACLRGWFLVHKRWRYIKGGGCGQSKTPSQHRQHEIKASSFKPAVSECMLYAVLMAVHGRTVTVRPYAFNRKTCGAAEGRRRKSSVFDKDWLDCPTTRTTAQPAPLMGLK